MFCRERAHGPQDLQAQPSPLVLWRYEGGQGRESRWRTAFAVDIYGPLHHLVDRGRQVLQRAIPDKGDGVSERDESVGGIVEQDLETGEGIEERVSVGSVGVEHESGPRLPSQAIYLLREFRPSLQGCYFECHPDVTGGAG